MNNTYEWISFPLAEYEMMTETKFYILEVSSG